MLHQFAQPGCGAGQQDRPMAMPYGIDEAGSRLDAGIKSVLGRPSAGRNPWAMLEGPFSGPRMRRQGPHRDPRNAVLPSFSAFLPWSDPAASIPKARVDGLCCHVATADDVADWQSRAMRRRHGQRAAASRHQRTRPIPSGAGRSDEREIQDPASGRKRSPR